VIEKVLFYLKDVDLDGDEELNEETFLVDEYSYSNAQLIKLYEMVSIMKVKILYQLPHFGLSMLMKVYLYTQNN